MITRIFFDLDETLIYSIEATNISAKFEDISERTEWDFEFYLNDFFREKRERFFTSVRPSALEILKWTRGWFGEENVFILTKAGSAYTSHINQFGKLGFKDDQIFSNLDWAHWVAWNDRKDFKYYDHTNVLIDNNRITHIDAARKRGFLGIGPDRYLWVDDYQGDFENIEAENKFQEQVKQFLMSKL